MIILSNNLIGQLPIPEEAIIRINMAWVQTKEELEQLIEACDHDIFLDYPQGRTKPPVPTIGVLDAIKIVRKYEHIKYFAVSNIEDAEMVGIIKATLPEHVELVPKIETEKGVDNFDAIVDEVNCKYIMLDKEDLFVAVKRDNKIFNELVEQVRDKAFEKGVNCLELQGVVFAERVSAKNDFERQKVKNKPRALLEDNLTDVLEGVE